MEGEGEEKWEGEIDRGCMVRVHWSGNTTMDGDREVDGELVGEPPPPPPPQEWLFIKNCFKIINICFI